MIKSVFHDKKCCNGFSIKLVKIAQDNEVRNLLTTDSRVDDPQNVM